MMIIRTTMRFSGQMRSGRLLGMVLLMFGAGEVEMDYSTRCAFVPKSVFFVEGITGRNYYCTCRG